MSCINYTSIKNNEHLFQMLYQMLMIRTLQQLKTEVRNPSKTFKMKTNFTPTIFKPTMTKLTPVSLVVISVTTVTNSSHDFLDVQRGLPPSCHTPHEVLCVLSQIIQSSTLYPLINQPPNALFEREGERERQKENQTRW